jgi:hypothetical protein
MDGLEMGWRCQALVSLRQLRWLHASCFRDSSQDASRDAACLRIICLSLCPFGGLHNALAKRTHVLRVGKRPHAQLSLDGWQGTRRVYKKAVLLLYGYLM